MEPNSTFQDKKISVVLIDSGIDPSIGGLKRNIFSQTDIIVDNGKITEVEFVKVKHMHGTSVALTMLNICNSIELTGINILDEGGGTDTRVLLYAMYKAVNIKPDIIHMSLGTENNSYISYFNEILDLAHKNEIIVVTALENEGKLSYPSCLNKSISVTYGAFKNKDIILKKGNSYVAPYKPIGVDGIDKINILSGGSSISAAYVTGAIANILLKNPAIKVDKVIKLLDHKVVASTKELVNCL